MPYNPKTAFGNPKKAQKGRFFVLFFPNPKKQFFETLKMQLFLKP
jgi:hypothetical protein